MMYKPCSKCKREKPLSEFGKHHYSKDGHRYKCKACALNFIVFLVF